MLLLFVCTGNTCRSPMAAAIAKHLIKDKDIFIESRGVYAQEGSGASKNAIEALKTEYAIELEHTAKQLTLEDINNGRLILTMTRSHKEFICQNFGNASDKVKTLNEYAFSKPEDIADPYGGDLKTYIRCANEIYSAVEKIKEILNEDSNSL